MTTEKCATVRSATAARADRAGNLCFRPLLRSFFSYSIRRAVSPFAFPPEARASRRGRKTRGKIVGGRREREAEALAYFRRMDIQDLIKKLGTPSAFLYVAHFSTTAASSAPARGWWSRGCLLQEGYEDQRNPTKGQLDVHTYKYTHIFIQYIYFLYIYLTRRSGKGDEKTLV